ncbi:ANTAR domain-containing protein [Streptomyces sp. NPDC057403]|uniref:ANTAR domain-containing protein n=1 Tax=Streptomyces sp. NPDC057403 TaxID=3346119 RepID=UPI0036A34F8B
MCHTGPPPDVRRPPKPRPRTRTCTEEEAFDLLRRLSQETNVKLRDVCARLLTDLAGRSPRPRPPLRPRP